MPVERSGLVRTAVERVGNPELLGPPSLSRVAFLCGAVLLAFCRALATAELGCPILLARFFFSFPAGFSASAPWGSAVADGPLATVCEGAGVPAVSASLWPAVASPLGAQRPGWGALAGEGRGSRLTRRVLGWVWPTALTGTPNSLAVVIFGRVSRDGGSLELGGLGAGGAGSLIL